MRRVSRGSWYGKRLQGPEVTLRLVNCRGPASTKATTKGEPAPSSPVGVPVWHTRTGRRLHPSNSGAMPSQHMAVGLGGKGGRLPLADHLWEGVLGHVETQPPGTNDSSEEAEERDCRDELGLGAAVDSWKSPATIRYDRPFIATNTRRCPILLARGLEA